jgi:hypothetical protein
MLILNISSFQHAEKTDGAIVPKLGTSYYAGPAGKATITAFHWHILNVLHSQPLQCTASSQRSALVAMTILVLEALLKGLGSLHRPSFSLVASSLLNMIPCLAWS